MHWKTIKTLQDENGISDMQDLINSGQVWKLEGSMGRQAMYLLEVGACMLPKQRHTDYYGNVIPSREDLKPGTKGTYKNSVQFWTSDNYFFDL